MGIGVTILSIVLLFIAAIVGFRITIVSRRLASLPLAIAILLMGLRRSFSLYNQVAFQRPLDVGAEIIALMISALMVVGLISVRRWVFIDEFRAHLKSV